MDRWPHAVWRRPGLWRWHHLAPAPTEADLAPARIALQGVEARVSGLVLNRDIYYTLSPGDSDYDYYDAESTTSPARPFDSVRGSAAERVVQKFDILGDPKMFPELGQLASRDFEIRPGHYMMMGDNSPRSKDSRGWSTDDQLRFHPSSGWDPNIRESWEVPEALLIGKAFYVYWPHGMPFGPTSASTAISGSLPTQCRTHDAGFAE